MFLEGVLRLEGLGLFRAPVTMQFSLLHRTDLAGSSLTEELTAPF